MNTSNAKIVNIDLVSSRSDLNNYLNFRCNDVKKMREDISSALVEFKEAKVIEDNPTTAKNYVTSWIGRKINFFNDPISEIIKEGSAINLKIADLTKSHFYGILIFTADLNSDIKKLPFKIKMMIIRHLDKAYLKKINKYDKQLLTLTQKVIKEINQR